MGSEIGIAQVQLRNLVFPHSRDKIPAAVENLAAVFKENCKPVAVQNLIPVYVRPGELEEILKRSNVRSEDIQRCRPPYPRLDPPSHINALHGRQRSEAALQSFGPQTWWGIKIFCISDRSNPETVLYDEMNQFSSQKPDSDMEIFRRVCLHQRAGQWNRAHEWRLRLSESKRRSLGGLLASGAVCDRMYELTQYPGFRQSLKLGIMQKHLAEHCVEEICYYLDHIKDTWARITLDKLEVQQATDLKTVEALERLAPSCASIDQEKIESLMRSGVLFPRVSDPGLRREIEQQLINIGVIIPSIKTLQENMSYLHIGMRILREHLLGRPIMVKGETVAQGMRSIWSPGANLIEYAEDQFYPAISCLDFSMAYQIIFISALRNFPRLSTDTPKVERGQETISSGIDEQYLARFLRHAQALGFTSSTIENKLRQLPPTTTPPSLIPVSTCKTQEPNIKRRTGRPYAGSYNVISRHLFLPEMLRNTEIGANPSIIFIQTDFMRSFFHEFPDHPAVIAENPDADTAQSSTSIPTGNEPLPVAGSSLRDTPVQTVDSPQSTQALAMSQSPNTSFQLPAPVMSAAVSARGRRQLQHQDSGSVRSILSPPQSARHQGGNHPSVSPPSININLEPSVPYQITQFRDTISSIQSQDTQGSDSTGRTILAPSDLYGYK